ncbi:ABC transporter permease [Tessaracoccus caeni]|uniref:ABC transporter permease n=1 Tax=Tessaracoccus caeni TaxID=3031239 RepID=UPI0023DCC727|nr:ABC transporter permease [Tessaracoccus caeni]MDF1489931.1 ABC transporter permease [Tessaracoccus caeni]
MSLAEQAREAGLHRVGARQPLGRYLRDVWSRRDFIATMARYRMRAGLETNRLGLAWIVLRPLLNALIYGAIFGLLQGNARPEGYAAYVVVGVFLFEFFTGCFNDGSKSITKNRNLVQSLAFPRMTLPLAVVVEQFLEFVITLVVLVPLLLAFGHYPSWGWLYMIPLVLLFTLLNTGIALITARLTVHVSDLSQLLPFISRLLFYTSGVLFAVDRVLEAFPWAVEAYDFHPLYQVLQIARHHLLGQAAYPAHYWLTLSLISVSVLVFGVLFFWAAEERYGRD